MRYYVKLLLLLAVVLSNGVIAGEWIGFQGGLQ